MAIASVVVPVPSRLEVDEQPTATASGFSRGYRLYTTAAAFFAAGLMSFECRTLSTAGTVTREWIPLSLALSTGIGVVTSLVLGALGLALVHEIVAGHGGTVTLDTLEEGGWSRASSWRCSRRALSEVDLDAWVR